MKGDFYIMKRVITYGTFDLLHYGHINILRRAKELGDYLIVVLSSDEFNWNEKQKKSYLANIVRMLKQLKQMLQRIRLKSIVLLRKLLLTLMIYQRKLKIVLKKKKMQTLLLTKLSMINNVQQLKLA